MIIDAYEFYDITKFLWFDVVEYKAVRKIGFQFPEDEPVEMFPVCIKGFDTEKKLVKHLSLIIKEIMRTQDYKKAKKELLNAKSE